MSVTLPLPMLWAVGVVSVLGGIVTFVVALPKLWAILTGMTEAVTNLQELPKWQKKVDDQIKVLVDNQKVVLHESQHNGGMSIKDDTKRTNDAVKQLNQKVDDLVHALDSAYTTGTFILPKRDIQPKEPEMPVA